MADETEQTHEEAEPLAAEAGAEEAGGETAAAASAAAGASGQEALLRENVIARKLWERFPDAIQVVYCALNRPEELTALVDRQRIVEICRFCHDDPDLYFNLLSDLCGADYPDEEERFTVVYQLYSIRHNQRLRLKVKTKEGVPVPSVTSVWRTANWHEREAYDLYGIVFEGHPNLKRILMPDNWEGFPLRKEYPPEGQGMRERV
ncbi:MAG: NADH-quinone oxidoreductase subunit C [Candidatus Tectomicrobia bacterium]|nr:NADH-quinone oxidoreductase subunit C [Candidatus Tectomicrobia bacterium]